MVLLIIAKDFGTQLRAWQVAACGDDINGAFHQTREARKPFTGAWNERQKQKEIIDQRKARQKKRKTKDQR